jgi:glycosyltransferase involved in cell wall biosynthesis
MHILFVVSRELSYTRNDVLWRAFRRFSEVDVIGFEQRASLITRSVQCNLKVLSSSIRGKYDLVFVGFYGHLIMLMLAPILKKQPILYDAFLSTYDTLCFDRNRFSPSSIPGKMAFYLDQQSCRLSTATLLDSPQQIDYFRETFKLSPASLNWLPVGCNESLFYPRELPVHQETMRILYYCTYLPLHGVDVVLKAAKLVEDLPISFRLIGNGPLYTSMIDLATNLRLKRVEFIPTVPLSQLPSEIDAADICLGGHFGTSAKAGRVIPGKIYQIMAMGRPIIAGDTLANRVLLSHDKSAWLSQAGDPASLAEAIKELYHEPDRRCRLGRSARDLYHESCSETFITQKLHKLVESMTVN